MKKIIIVSILILFVTGCWNYKELNDYALVTGMAIDYTNKEYEVSFLIANGSKKEEEKAQITISSAKGKSIYEAMENISLSIPKELYISHLSVIVISESLAKLGLNPTLDLLMRDPQSHQNFYIVIAKNSLAKDELAILAPLAEYPSQNITSSIKTTEKSQGRITNANFNNFVGKILEKGIDPVANSLILIGDAEEGTDIEKQEKSSLENYTKLDTLAIFKGDKLVGWATEEESIGINLLLNEVDSFYLQIPCNDKNIVLVGNNYKVKNDISKNKINVTMTSEGIINEVNCKINLNDNKIIKEYEEKAAKKMEEYAKNAIKKAKNLKADVFGYGNQIYHKYPKYYNNIKNWNTEFTKLEINVNANFTITNTGAAKREISNLEE